MTNRDAKRVCIVGASGIGKHHANWWHLEGASVCAFVGTSEESVARTSDMLRETFGIETQGFTRLADAIDEEKPDFVDVCSPPPFHYEHAKTALESGCHVLCEKPFVYDKALSTERLLEQARELAHLAEQNQVRLGLCTQYSVGARFMLERWHQLYDSEPIRHYHGHLESPAKGRTADPERVWVDLAPHTISVLQKLLPDMRMDWESFRLKFKGYEAIACFEVHPGTGPSVACEIYTRNATEPPLNTRHFKINGYYFNIEGGKDEEGVYCSRITTPDGEYQKPDFMRVLIRDMLAGRVVADVDNAMENLHILLNVLNLNRQMAL